MSKNKFQGPDPIPGAAGSELAALQQPGGSEVRKARRPGGNRMRGLLQRRGEQLPGLLQPGGSQLRELLRRGDPARPLAPAESERMRAAVLDEAGRAARPSASSLPAGPRWWRPAHPWTGECARPRSRHLAGPWPGLAAAAASGLVLALTAVLAWKADWPPPPAGKGVRSRLTAPGAEIGCRSSTSTPSPTDTAGASALPRQIQFWTPGGTHIIWRLVPPPAASEAGDPR
jgi:hypothetical protein